VERKASNVTKAAAAAVVVVVVLFSLNIQEE
jgi:hypothetical protein